MHLHNGTKKGTGEYVDRFGFDVPTYCGSVKQGNQWDDDWVVSAWNVCSL